MLDTGFPRADVENEFLRARRHQVLATRQRGSGARTDDSAGPYKWWYFDAHLADGA